MGPLRYKFSIVQFAGYLGRDYRGVDSVLSPKSVTYTRALRARVQSCRKGLKQDMGVLAPAAVSNTEPGLAMEFFATCHPSGFAPTGLTPRQIRLRVRFTKALSHIGLGNSQSEAAAGPTAFAAEISRVPTRSIDGDVRCSGARDQCGRESGLQLLAANHRGGYRRPIYDDDGRRNKVTAIHSENSALLHLRKLNRGRREGRDCRGRSGASAQGVYGVAGWEGQQTHQTPKRNERSLPAGGTLHRSSYTQGLTRHVDRERG